MTTWPDVAFYAIMFYYLVHEPMTEECFKKILNYFDNDYTKAILWFSTKNPGIGNITPIKMVACGRERKLLQFIDCCLEGYFS